MRNVFIASFIFILFVLGSVFYLGNKGFCYKTGEFFDDVPIQDRIDNILMERILPNIKPKMVGYLGEGDRFDPVISYRNLNEFKQINHNCCVFLRYSEDVPDYIWARITGEIYGVVDIDFLEMRYYPGYISNNELECPLVERRGETLYISRCGTIKSFFYFW